MPHIGANRQDVLSRLHGRELAAIFAWFAPAAWHWGAERDAVDKNLAAESRRIDTAVAAMPDGLVLYARDGRIQHVNPAAEKLLGLPSDQAATPIDERLRGLRVLDASGKARRTRAAASGARLARRGGFHEVLILDGPYPLGRRSLSVSAVPIPGPDGAADGVVASLVDVTRLQQGQEQRDDLVRMVSHDLRTPTVRLALAGADAATIAAAWRSPRQARGRKSLPTASAWPP